jgi:hypothetical protein
LKQFLSLSNALRIDVFLRLNSNSQFMKSATTREAEKHAEEEQKLREHAAQWTLPNVKVKKTPTVKSFGYGELVAGDPVTVSGRRSFGKKAASVVRRIIGIVVGARI